jgi:DNA-binding GntR family transcriptional regulator
VAKASVFKHGPVFGHTGPTVDMINGQSTTRLYAISNSFVDKMSKIWPIRAALGAGLLKSLERADRQRGERRRTVSSRTIRDRLVSAITDHRLPPGTKLGEDRIAAIFGVSRARVHEALLQLCHERLITLQPHRGAFVSEPTIRETQEICEARKIIEAATVARVAKVHDQAMMSRLRGIVERENEAWKRGDRHAARRLSQGFHLALAEMAGNSIITESLRNILSRSALSIARYGRPRSPGCLCPEHFAILGAIENGKADRAIKLMTVHLDHIEQRMSPSIEEDAVDLAAALEET